MNTSKNDFGPHAVFKTREYYMLKIKSGHKKASLPKDVNLELHNHNVEKRNGYTKIHELFSIFVWEITKKYIGIFDFYVSMQGGVF